MKLMLITKNFNLKGIEQSFAYWETTLKLHCNQGNILNKISLKTDQNNLISTLSFLGVSVMFFRSIFFENHFYKDNNFNLKYKFTIIILNILISFQKNWNHELVQNLDLFSTVIMKLATQMKRYLKKDNWAKLSNLFNVPFLSTIGVDIKSTQNKILNAQNTQICLEMFGITLKKNSEENAFFVSIKINFFLDFGKYLKLLLLKTKVSEISTKRNFSKICFEHFLLSKVENLKRKNINLMVKKIHLVFLKINHKEQKFSLSNLSFIRRK